jgi:hypothetical protein
VVEKIKDSANLYEKTADAEQFGEIAHERHEAIKNALDREERKHNERHSEREIIAKAKELANKAEEAQQEHHKASPAERRSGPINKRQLDSSFKSQMKFAEAEMSPSERIFSKIIHNKPVEKISNVAGSTVARPNAMLSGSIAAFLGITILYFVSKYYGFQLSGFETIACFVFGWVIGILYDYIRVMIKGHNR